MQWKKILESNDLIAYEKRKRDIVVRMEARFVDKTWHVFKTYNDGRSCRLSEEYVANSKTELEHLINKLKKEKDLTKQDILRLSKNPKIDVKLERAFKELDVEKWIININKEGTSGFVFIRYSLDIDVDVVVNEKYRHIEHVLIDELKKDLGLEEFGANVNFRFYFFTKSSRFSEGGGRKGILVGKIEIGVNEEELD